ncbi:MAG: Fe-S cluster assembly protein SufD [Ignavibacteria bacterium]|nr:Fe-S cluster assembly protein SufD [Ignavibacteria bacterium]
MISKQNLKEYLIEEFERNKEWFKNISPSELFEQRIKSINYFSEYGFPTRKDEEWRFTDINPLTKNLYAIVGIDNKEFETKSILEKEINKHLIKNLDINLLVLINGVYSKQHSLIKEEIKTSYIGSISEILKSNPDVITKYLGKAVNSFNDAFTAINTAFTTDGVFIYIPKNVSTEKPFHILNIITGEKNILSNTRNVIVADLGADITVIESFHFISVNRSVNLSLFNSVTEIFLLPNSRVSYYKIQKEENLPASISTTQVIQERDSHFNSFTMTLNGVFVRNNLNSILRGENCECVFKGIYVGDKSSLIDNHTLVDHSVPRCYSNEYYKGIIGDEAHGVFNGKILVRKDAQKTNAYQSNKNILISDKATINAKPQLEIFADDVKCSHGATSGRLNADELFYLRARGIPEKAAKKLLLQAFLVDVIDSENNYPESKSYRKVIDNCIVKAISEKINSINL